MMIITDGADKRWKFKSYYFQREGMIETELYTGS